ncbi:Outer membrane protein [Candidatus Terasakiella magnetica]|uniref:Outer membrane protein n=1 Tax=Candidatus Terasakiella magnetica TaxID=1867952 RepID=A0A1C3RCH0_9PROT|nr:TolC family outer membrane protein [Candidatus Terasakiella magnetica]SCA54912.1 Outer membrane protein [Candidatus Terasakiella magnetica]
MKLRKNFLLGVALGAMAFGVPAHADTLEEALIKAYLNNPSLNAERASVRASDEGVSQALANWRPNVTWTGSAYRSINENNSRLGDDRRQVLTPLASTFSVTQPLFRGFQTLSAVDEAEATIKAERWRLIEEEQGILLNTVTAYSNVVRDLAVLELNKNNEAVLLRQLEATKDRFEVGELTRTDVSQAEARYAKSTADRIQSEADLESSRANYYSLVGEMPTAVATPSVPSNLPTSVDETIAAAKKNNPEFLASVYDEEAAIENIDEMAGKLLPELNLVASSETSLEASSIGGRSDTAKIGLTLSVPFYQKGTVYSQVREAKQTAAEKRMDMEQARRDAIESGHSGWEEYVAAKARIQSFLSQIRAAEVALDGVQREAAVGSRTVLDVLDAEQELLDAKVSLVRAERDQLVAAYELKRAIGGLTAEKLGLDTGIYDPNVHYDEVRDAWIGTSSVGDIDELEKVDNN